METHEAIVSLLKSHCSKFEAVSIRLFNDIELLDGSLQGHPVAFGG